MAGLTALQSLRAAGVDRRARPLTVFLQGPLGGVGSVQLQLAARHFGVTRTIASVSARKLAQASELFGQLPGVEMACYSELAPAKQFAQQADVVLHTAGSIDEVLPIMKKQSAAAAAAAHAAAPSSAHGGAMVPKPMTVSVCTIPSGAECELFGTPMPWLVRKVLDLADWNTRRKARAHGGDYSFCFMLECTADLALLTSLADHEGKLRPVVAQIFPFNLQRTREAMQLAQEGKLAGKQMGPE